MASNHRINQEPLVSVIICTYNRKNTISQTINSILSQTCNFSFEIIIGDDCSTDGTKEICMAYKNQYPNEIKLVFQAENGGVGRNWASAVKEAKGKYLAFCDDDDYWHNVNKLQVQVDYLEKNLNCGAVHTEIDIFNEVTGKTLTNSYQRNNTKIVEGNIFKEIFQGGSKICMSSFCVRKSIIDQYLPLDDFINFRFPLQDWPTWMVVAKYSDINYIPISTTTYRIGNLGITKMKDFDKAEERFRKEFKMYKYICGLFSQDLIYSESNYLIYSERVLLNLAYKQHDYKNARKYAKQLTSKGQSNLKTICGQNTILFQVFLVLKKIKNVFSHNSFV